MSVMTTPELWPELDRILTVEDMENMPDDEFRYELDDGVLVVSPAPGIGHQLAVAQVTGEQPYQAVRPFPVSVVPAGLGAGPPAPPAS